MKLEEISPESLKDVSNTTLTVLHLRVHQIYTRRIKQNIDAEFLKSKHSIIKDEMNRRGLKHNPQSMNQVLSKLQIYGEGLD